MSKGTDQSGNNRSDTAGRGQDAEWLYSSAPKRSKVVASSDEDCLKEEPWWKKNIGMLTRRDVHGGEPPSCLRFVLRDSQKADSRPVTMLRDRIRIVGSCQTLGAWKVDGGADLLWQGGEWVSLLIEVPSQSWIEYCILRAEHPDERWKYENSSDWSYTWSQKYAVQAPGDDAVLEITQSCVGDKGPQLHVIPRIDILSRPLQDLHRPGEQRCYTFDSSKGVTLHYALHLPHDHCRAHSQLESDTVAKKWPLLLFLHAMYNRLDGDNSLFYTSDTPPRLLLDGGIEGEAPDVLRDGFVVLSPQCPPDPSWRDGVGVWLKQGWYTDNEQSDPGSEEALWELLSAVCNACSIDPDRIYITGCSMGARACFDLLAKRPNLFAAVVPVAAYYEEEENLETMMSKLSPASEVPFWFVHALNDQCCPFDKIEGLIQSMRQKFSAELHLTSYEDTWSETGHSSDFVAYRSKPCSCTRRPLAVGNDICNWLLQQRRHAPKC